MPNGKLPFWLVNMPAGQRPSECPDFLAGCSEKDKRIIGTPDEEYQLLSCAEVRDIVGMFIHPATMGCYADLLVLIRE